MNTTIFKKIIAGMMLTTFCLSHLSVLSAVGVENIGTIEDYVQQNAVVDKPALRENKAASMRLKGDVRLTDKKIPINLSLRESDVKQVLRMFADKAGMNIIFYNSVNGKITLDLVDVPLNDAFDMVLETAGLTYAREGNTILVASATDQNFTAMKQEMSLIPVKYVDAAAIALFLNKNIFTLKRPGFSGSEIAVTNPARNEILIMGSKNDAEIAKKIVEKFDKKPEIATFTVKHTTPAEMADMVCNTLLKATVGTEGESSDSDTIETGDDSDIIEEPDEEPLTLGGGVVACTVATKIEENNIVSVPLQNMAVSYYTQLGVIKVVGGSPEQIDMIREFIENSDKKQPMAYLEMSIVELTEAGSREFQNQWSYWSKHFSANFTGTQFQTNSNYPIFITGDKNQDPNGKGEEYHGEQTLMYSIRYLIENRKGRVVANPRILITNGQESVIDLTSDYVKTVTSHALMGAGGIAGAVQRQYEIGDDNGIKITITPFISPEGYVTLNIEPDYATVAETVYQENEETGTRDLAATLLQRRNLTLKNVRIKDGETLVIGGMIREEDSKQVNKIPFLGDIPIVGAIFRSSNREKSKEAMIIMITPKIVIDTEDAAPQQIEETL